MIIVTTDDVPGRRIVTTHGLVRGSAVRSRSLPRDIMAFVRGLVGGEIPEYTKTLAETREQALDRMAEAAQATGANAIVGMRFVSAELMGSAAELLAYGTAVTIE
ncbi:MAG: YbjQ family protein [Acidobacteria bacterium]|nr:YbjQ family protein [Acidobacteriota bacterium]